MDKRFVLAPICAGLLLANDGICTDDTPDSQSRQAQATFQAANAADREAGYPRIANFAQRKLLKNAYEDMD